MSPSVIIESQANGTAHQRPPIAICGMALRLPGGISTPSQFWELIINKRDAVGTIPESRFSAGTYVSEAGKAGYLRTIKGYFLDIDIGALDTTFFSMPRAEVERADPQQRILLEVARECLDSAGEVEYRGKDIGTYIGSFGEDWSDHFAKDSQNVGLYQVTGKGDFILANRLSYEYDLRGPSMTIRTACSSSLLALHEACLSLWTGGCSSALVGGCNLIFSPDMYLNMTEQGVLSSDASCKTFDDEANGYARAEAVNMIYIKPLQDALRDGNPIRAIIKGAWTNADGKTPGLSVPSTASHEAMIRRAYASAGITDFSETAFVECHGTGTSIGDPIEAKAIQAVFDSGVFIGSVKPNVGHSEGASGITSIIKCVMALEHQTIPPNIKFNQPSQKIDFSNLRVPTDPQPWPTGCRERVSINSFGIGGTNAHIVIDSMRDAGIQPKLSRQPPLSRDLLFFSASTLDSAHLQVINHGSYVREHPFRVQDIAYTLGLRREHMPYRSFGVVDTTKLITSGELTLESSPVAKVSAVRPQIAMIFTGQGAQWPQMGSELLQSNTAFTAAIHEMDRNLQELPDKPSWSIHAELQKPASESSVYLAAISQPLSTAVQVALVDALADVGVHAQAVVGHSSGEIAAAYAHGTMSAKEAIITAYYRGVVSNQVCQQGSMAAIGMGLQQVSSFLQPGVVLACENSPSSVTISGDSDKVDLVLQSIRKGKGDSISARLLKVDKAYHSHHMKEIGARYLAMVSPYLQGGQKLRPGTARMYSSVTGTLLEVSSLTDAQYWRANLENPVLFRSAIEGLLSDFDKSGSSLVFLEVGTHGALAGPLRQIMAQDSSRGYLYTSCLTRPQAADLTYLKAIGYLWQQGVNLNLDGLLNQHGTANVVPDLPLYPWHHEHSYIFTSRVSDHTRYRKFRKHELLGLRTAESTDSEPIFRNMLVLDRVPWLRDHDIDGNVVFPCAGYLGLIGEAVRQLGTEEFHGYSVRNVTVDTALVIDGSKPIEIITSLRKVRLTDTLDGSWWDFTIASHTGSSWIRHCAGQVRSHNLRSDKLSNFQTDELPRLADVRKWYTAFKYVGANYGPSFKVLRDIACSSSSHIAKGNSFNTTHDNEEQYAIHPTIIDGCLQLYSIAAHRGIPHKLSRMTVPTFIKSMSVNVYGSAITVRAEATTNPRGVVCGNATGFGIDGSIVFKAQGVTLSPLSTGSTSRDSVPHAARINWHLHLDSFDMPKLINTSDAHIEKMELYHELALKCIEQSLARLADKHLEGAKSSHFVRFITWMKEQSSPSSSLSLQSIVDQLKGSHLEPLVHGCLKVLENIELLLTGDIQLLDMLIRNGVLARLYDSLVFTDCSPLFRAFGHTMPNMRILEIGAGTGSTTSKLLKGLAEAGNGSQLYLSYTYTDISAGFFAEAKERFQDYPNIIFQTLDIEKDPLQQGFAAESYDLIVASNVIHASHSLQESLRNVHKIIHPQGRLYLEELCCETKAINFVMGLFPGWWLGDQDGRTQEPYVSPERWDRELRKAGFSGLSAVTLDAPRPYQSCALMLARPESPHDKDKSVTILHDHASENLATALQNYLGEQYYSTVSSIDEPFLPVSRDIIAVLDLKSPFLESITQEKFYRFQKLIEEMSTSRKGCLWVTRSSQLGCVDPRWSQIIGAARSIRRDLSFDFATCEIDRVDETSWRAVAAIFEDFQSRSHNNGLGPEYEYAVLDGDIYIPRIAPISFTDDLTAETTGNTPSDCFLDIRHYGRLQSLLWKELPPRNTLVGDEVLVDIHCVGLNFKDLLIAMGVLDPKASTSSSLSLFGIEGVGVIREIGPAVRDLNVGQRIFMMSSHGCFASRLTISEKYCAPIPDSLDSESAATMPCVFATAIYGLIDVGQLRSNHSVLIHSACGGVGLAAIQIAQRIGAEIFCTVSNEEKIQYLEANYGIPRVRVFNSRDSSFHSGILEATGGRGVDLVLNSLSGELLHASWGCVAEFGKLVEIGKRDLVGNGSLDLRPFLENRSYHGVDLSQFFESKPEECHRLLREIMRMYNEGHIHPISPFKVFRAQDIEACFRYMQKGQHMGKIVVSMESMQQLTIELSNKQVIFDSSASFILVGGLGGLGRPVTNWMIECGARHFVFLSRTAAKSQDDQAFSKELMSQGCSATFIAGDVTLISDVERAITSAPTPIKGIINMSMVLRDCRFEAMTYEEWTAATRPKVQGTWNLHNICLAHNITLDIFLLFGSLSGVMGYPGQTNYASGNTFMDAFVQYRQTQGLNAAVVDVGFMIDHGYVAENEALQQQFTSYGHYGIRVPQLLDSLRYAICSARAMQEGAPLTSTSQLLLGVHSTKSLSDPTSRVIWKDDRRLAAYFHQTSTVESIQAPNGNILSDFLDSVDSDPSILGRPDSASFVAKQIAIQLSALLLKPIAGQEDVDVSISLQDVGLDSLVAIEMRAWWRAVFGLDITILEMLGSESVLALGEKVISGLKQRKLGLRGSHVNGKYGTQDHGEVNDRKIQETKLP